MDDYLDKNELNEYIRPPMFTKESLTRLTTGHLTSAANMPAVDSKEQVLRYLADIYGKIEDGDISVLTVNETRERSWDGNTESQVNIRFLNNKKDMI